MKQSTLASANPYAPPAACAGELSRRPAGLILASACLLGALAQPANASPPASTQPQADLVLPHPAILEANNVQINVNALEQSGATVTVTYPGIAAGHTVGLRWVSDKQKWDSEIKTVGEQQLVIFKIPANVIALDAGGHALLTSSVKTQAGGQLVISSPLSVSVSASDGPGERVAAALNARFLDTRAACDNGTPAYYCNGIMLRATEDGPFDPWDPSPRAIALGSVSFTWMRRGTHVTTTHTPSGFIFLPQQQAIEQDKQVDYRCVYAYDAWTALPDRPGHGCGFQPKPEAKGKNEDLSTCKSVNATTVEGWQAYNRALPPPQDGVTPSRYQCSLSTRDAAQFAVSYTVRENRPPNITNTYNEVLIETWPQNIPLELPLEAFFYTNADGRKDARVYQGKYKDRTGQWLPIIKLDLSRLPTTTPISYTAADQAVQP